MRQIRSRFGTILIWPIICVLQIRENDDKTPRVNGLSASKSTPLVTPSGKVQRQRRNPGHPGPRSVWITISWSLAYLLLYKSISAWLSINACCHMGSGHFHGA
jgi:hypothetical protein